MAPNVPSSGLSALINRRASPSGVDDNLTDRSTEQRLQTVQDVTAEDAFLPVKSA